MKSDTYKNICVHIWLFVSGALLIALLILFQIDQSYLYDVSFLHSVYLYIAAAIVVAFIVLAIIKSIKFKWAVSIVNTVMFFLVIIFVFWDFTWVSSSQTNNIENYKKFDIQVQDSVEAFFPDLKENYDVIKYDYYYNYSYHHVYSIYLEIKVNGDMEDLLNEYRKGDYKEQSFYYDDSFTEISFDDSVQYVEDSDRLYRGNIKKILYSPKEKIVVFQCFQSWAYCDADEVYYFERFNIDPSTYAEIE